MTKRCHSGLDPESKCRPRVGGEPSPIYLDYPVEPGNDK